MKTIEEKAQSAWVDYTYPEGNLYSNVFKDAYKLGAAEALSSQWQSPESILECKDRRVITIYRTNYEESWFTTISVDHPREWSDPVLHGQDELIAWMRIPELPKNE